MHAKTMVASRETQERLKHAHVLNHFLSTFHILEKHERKATHNMLKQ